MKRLHALGREIHAGRAPKQVLELCIHGPGGTGKTRGISTDLYWLGNLYPGIRILVLRDVRADLATTFQKVWEEDVVPKGHPMLRKRRERAGRKGYNFWNGWKTEHPTMGATTIELGGMDDIMRHRGTDYDVIYFLELVEQNDEGQWSEFRRALRNFGGEQAKRLPPEKRIPFQLLIADTNPSAPDHWILQREERGEIELMQSFHRDNPKFFRKDGTKTEEGVAFMSSLDALHGVRRAWLRDGLWVAAEGVVYENWDRHQHIIERKSAEELGIRWYYASMDWGHTDPCVLLIGGVDGEGRTYIVAEWYLRGMGIDFWTDTVVTAHRTYDLLGIVVDPSRPEMIERFNDRLSFGKDRPFAFGADNARASSGTGDMGGLDLVRQALGDPKRPDTIKIKFFRDCLQHAPQQELIDRSRATCTVKEFASYVYRRGKTETERINNRMTELTDPTCDDHGMDTLRYLKKAIHNRDMANRPKKPEREMSPEDQALARAMGRDFQ